MVEVVDVAALAQLAENAATVHAREVRDMARRLAALVLLQPALDKNYRSVTDATYVWPTQAS